MIADAAVRPQNHITRLPAAMSIPSLTRELTLHITKGVAESVVRLGVEEDPWFNPWSDNPHRVHPVTGRFINRELRAEFISFLGYVGDLTARNLVTNATTTACAVALWETGRETFVPRDLAPILVRSTAVVSDAVKLVTLLGHCNVQLENVSPDTVIEALTLPRDWAAAALIGEST